MKSRIPGALVAASLSLASSASAQVADTAAWRRNGIFVVAALHREHESEPSFGYGELRAIIEKADPGVLVLEVRPDELESRGDTPGRPEYPKAIWPLLAARPLNVASMEPGGDAFRRFAERSTAAVAQRAKQDSAAVALWGAYLRAYSATMQGYWGRPSDVHDDNSAVMSKAFYAAQRSLLGDAYAVVQRDWDDFMIARAWEAAVRNPDTRVVIVASYRNRHRFVEALRARAPDRVVDMKAWLTSVGY